MTDTELIDAAIGDVLDIGAVTIDDATIRARVLRYANKRASEFRRRKPWSWRFATATVTVNGGTGQGNLPVNFASFGQAGGCVTQVSIRRLLWAEAGDIMEWRTRYPSTSDTPTHYSVVGFGDSESETDAGFEQLTLYPILTNDADVTINYESAWVAMVDDDTDIAALGIPADFHESVLLEGIKADLWESEGDGRAPVALGNFNKAIARAWADTKPRHTISHPTERYGGGLRSGGGYF